MQKLPIGIQDFRELREGGYLFIDKTPHIERLLGHGKYFFLSRPRRFGKSLLLSTIKEIYSGSKELFGGLWIEKNWDWTKKHPVLHFHFNSIGHQGLGLEKAIGVELKELAKEQNIVLEQEGIVGQFRELLKKLTLRDGKVVLLIDEYDKPIIDYLDKEKRQQAHANQAILKRFYSVIKSSDPYLEFLLITGVSKFSKTGVFSELNNLEDLTLDWQFSSMTGYTQEEIEHYFEPYRALARKRNKCDDEELAKRLKVWYNGYSWDAEIYVYNPFSILNFFKKGEFQNFWFETGTPTFLVNILKEHFYYEFDEEEVGATAFNSYDIDNLDIIPLLFQTGYLTIKEKNRNLYTLGYPNQEVKESMLQHLISAFRHSKPSQSLC